MATLMGQKKFLSPFILKMTMNDILRRRKKKSHSALVYNAASYVARKAIAKNACPSCAGHLCVSRSGASADESSYYTSHFDNGGLIYPSDALAKTVTLMEDVFTSLAKAVFTKTACKNLPRAYSC